MRSDRGRDVLLASTFLRLEIIIQMNIKVSWNLGTRSLPSVLLTIYFFYYLFWLPRKHQPASQVRAPQPGLEEMDACSSGNCSLGKSSGVRVPVALFFPRCFGRGWNYGMLKPGLTTESELTCKRAVARVHVASVRPCGTADEATSTRGPDSYMPLSLPPLYAPPISISSPQCPITAQSH